MYVTVHKSFVSTSLNIIHCGCTFHLSYPYWMITSLYQKRISLITVTMHKLTWTPIRQKHSKNSKIQPQTDNTTAALNTNVSTMESNMTHCWSWSPSTPIKLLTLHDGIPSWFTKPTLKFCPILLAGLGIARQLHSFALSKFEATLNIF